MSGLGVSVLYFILYDWEVYKIKRGKNRFIWHKDKEGKRKRSG